MLQKQTLNTAIIAIRILVILFFNLYPPLVFRLFQFLTTLWAEFICFFYLCFAIWANIFFCLFISTFATEFTCIFGSTRTLPCICLWCLLILCWCCWVCSRLSRCSIIYIVCYIRCYCTKCVSSSHIHHSDSYKTVH